MATVLDSLTLELGWDVKKFLEGAKETEARVKSTREDFERSSKVWDATIGSLVRTLSGLVAAFLSVEAAIKGIEWTRGASQAATGGVPIRRTRPPKAAYPWKTESYCRLATN